MGCCGSKEKKTVAPVAPKAPAEEQLEDPANFEEAYEVQDEMGRGAFSVVYKAKNKRTKEESAVKFIDKKIVDKKDLVLLEREIDIMKKVEHPNVLKLKEVFNEESTLYLVMELFGGGELFYKIVERGNYTENDAALIVKQMIDGVAYLHSEGICHRDLKPENLLCSAGEEKGFKPFRIAIADFGLSKVFDGGDALMTSCGTPDYVAPEVITAEESYDKSVDMWSCGVITYVLLCGFSPFAAADQKGMFDRILSAKYEFPDPEWTNISKEAKDFISHLLLQNPQERWTAEQCKDHPWLSGQFIGSKDPLAGGDIARRITEYHLKRKETKHLDQTTKKA